MLRELARDINTINDIYKYLDRGNGSLPEFVNLLTKYGL
jgi:hypothetical protein